MNLSQEALPVPVPLPRHSGDPETPAESARVALCERHISKVKEEHPLPFDIESSVCDMCSC